MRQYLFGAMLALGAAACATRPAETTSPAATPAARGGQTGAGTAREAVDAFLASVRAQDVQATSAIWGTKDGAARDNGRMDRTELEKRVLIMQCFLAHDSARVVNDLPSAEGRRTLRVELTNAGRTRQTNFVAVQGPRGRWYVESADLEPVKEFCRNPS